jgi:hypothetical protein
MADSLFSNAPITSALASETPVPSSRTAGAPARPLEALPTVAESARTPRHRGPHPEDARLFSRVARTSLRVAAEELAWLLGRGYAMASALELVARHHQLESRQRAALFRGVCSEAVQKERSRRLVPSAELAGRVVHVDGLNVVITLEVALSGGVLLRARDDVLRDLAGVRRNYHLVAETNPAIQLIAEGLRAARARAVHVFIDAEVSNSGRLRERFAAKARLFGGELTIDLVPNADRALAGCACVASSDAEVIDGATSWINLSRTIVAHAVHKAWVVDLS